MEKGKGVLWFLYVCVLGLGFSRTTASLTRMMGLSVSAYFLLTAALIIAVLLLFYLPGKLLAGKTRAATKKNAGRCEPKTQGREPFGTSYRIGLPGWLSGALLLGALVCVRLFLAPNSGSTAGWPGFERAASALWQDGFRFFLNDLYVRTLSVLIHIFGENSSVFFGNLILQMLGSLFLYFGVYMLAGGICACTALLSVICLPVFHNSTYMAEPQSLLYFFFGMVLWICALCIRTIERKADAGKLLTLPGFVAGLFCGAACGVHLLYCSLFLLFPAHALRYRKKVGFMRFLAVFFLTAAGSFFLILYLDHVWNGQGLELVWMRWLKEGISREHDAILHSPTLVDLWLTVPVYLLAFLAVFGVLEQERAEGSIAWILPFLTVMGAELIGGAPLQEQGIRFVLLGVMAGYGIRQTICAPGGNLAVAGDEEAGRWKVEVGEQMELEFVDESGNDLAEGMEKKAAAQNEQVGRGVSEKQENTVEVQRPAPGTWLDNPLPVPKRHVKKEMSYGFEPEPDQMFFDIPVSDLDDFDIE